jgi:serine carboxypeptidase-like clade 2
MHAALLLTLPLLLTHPLPSTLTATYVLAVIGTRNWIRGLQLPVTSAWRSWHGRTGQVGGWTVGHGKLTFATVRGAGHMVPYTQQVRALDMFTRWIHRQPL